MSFLFRDAGPAAGHGRALCPQGSVVCIGAFDGLHLGHRALVDRAVAARQAGAVAAGGVALSAYLVRAKVDLS